MEAACKYRVVVLAVIVGTILLSLLQADAHSSCTETGYRTYSNTAYDDHGWPHTVYVNQLATVCCQGYGPSLPCHDINECTRHTNRCHANATCNNIEGSYTCSCNSGFTGDGFSCSDIDECAENTDECHYHATCNNIPGSYQCYCNTGYRGDGFQSCTDINECTEDIDRCHPDATCCNTDGNYTCFCNTGFRGDGLSCTNVDECAEGTDYCDSIATCYDIQGSYSCSCKFGYQGNGFYCRDVDECARGVDFCHDNATCNNTEGSYTCICDSGYTGNGLCCTNVDECLSDNGGCHHNCQDSDGSYTCSCNNGYQLNSDGHKCDDINECLINNGSCHHICYNNNGSYTCSCNDGYQLTSDAHTCEAVDCGTLTDPSNGVVTHIAGTTFGQTVNYSCNTEYYLIGNSTRTCQATGYWSWSAPVCQLPGDVWFSLRNKIYYNNSRVNLEEIGEGQYALLCVTNLTSCCRPPYALGNWFFPNGTRVPSSGTNWDFHRTRGHMVVYLHRRRGGMEGIYHCEIPDSTNMKQTIYIGVYTPKSPIFPTALVIGVAGGAGMAIFCATFLVIVVCAIVKRRRASKVKRQEATLYIEETTLYTEEETTLYTEEETTSHNQEKTMKNNGTSIPMIPMTESMHQGKTKDIKVKQNEPTDASPSVKKTKETHTKRYQ